MDLWERFDLINLVVANYHCSKEHYPMFMDNYSDTWVWRWFYLIKVVLCIFFNWENPVRVKFDYDNYECAIRYNFDSCYNYDGRICSWEIVQIGMGLFTNWWFFIDYDCD